MSARSTLTRGSTLVAVGLAATFALAACGSSSDPLASSSSAATSAAASGSGSAAAGSKIVIGSANFPESALLANIYASALTAKGVEVGTNLNIGAREVYIKALQDGSIDLVPEYTGVLLQYFDPTATASLPDDVYTALVAKTPDGLTVLEKSSAEDKDALVVTKEFADTNKLKSIADLAPIQGQVAVGGPPEFQTRQTGLVGLESVYGLPATAWKEFKALDADGPLTLNALTGGSIQAGNLFSTNSNITPNNLVVLDDPKNVFGSQNVVPLINSDKNTPEVTAALNAVSAALDTATLTELVSKVVNDKQDSAQVAEEWVAANITG